MNPLVAYLSASLEIMTKIVGTWYSCRRSLGPLKAVLPLVNSIFKRLLVTRLEKFVASGEDGVAFAPTGATVQVKVTGDNFLKPPASRWKSARTSTWTVYNFQAGERDLGTVMDAIRAKGMYLLAVSPYCVALVDLREIPETSYKVTKASVTLTIAHEEWIWRQALGTKAAVPTSSFVDLLDSFISAHRFAPDSEVTLSPLRDPAPTEEEEIALAESSLTWNNVCTFYLHKALTPPTIRQFVKDRRDVLETMYKHIKDFLLPETYANERIKKIKADEKKDIKDDILRP